MKEYIGIALRTCLIRVTLFGNDKILLDQCLNLLWTFPKRKSNSYVRVMVSPIGHLRYLVTSPALRILHPVLWIQSGR